MIVLVQFCGVQMFCFGMCLPYKLKGVSNDPRTVDVAAVYAFSFTSFGKGSSVIFEIFLETILVR